MTLMTTIQCGAPPPEIFEKLRDDEKDEKCKDPELPHDYRCNIEFHKREEVDKSRKDFNWKVVEPYDGKNKNTNQPKSLKV